MIAAEEWRPVVGWEDLYQVSCLGHVRSLARMKLLSPVDNGKGYGTISLSRGGRVTRRTVHRLVADAFLGPRPPGTEANHKNADKADNRLENLEYCSHQENLRHAVALGLQANRKYKRCAICGDKGHAAATCDHPAALEARP